MTNRRLRVGPLHTSRVRHSLGTVAAVLALLPLGCGVVVGGGSLSEAPEEVGGGEVGMQLFSDPTGSTLLLVPVSFGDAGPFQFVLDTGASRTVIDPGLVEELGLPTGSQARGRGVVTEFEGALVDVETWRIGDIELEPRTIVAAELPAAPQGPQFRGLLGSDILAGFGVVEIDYDRKILTLRTDD